MVRFNGRDTAAGAVTYYAKFHRQWTSGEDSHRRGSAGVVEDRVCPVERRANILLLAVVVHSQGEGVDQEPAIDRNIHLEGESDGSP